MLKLLDFDYQLPKELIAQYPLKERESAKLLILNRKTGAIEHRIFSQIPEYLRDGDLLALNDTKVLACRLIGKRRATGGRVELLLVKHKNKGRFSALVKPARLKLNEEVIFNNGSLCAKLSKRDEVVFNTDDLESIYRLGRMPLPPYIKRDALELDNNYYQTVYADKLGAIASPTAGLHFSQGLLGKLKAGSINLAYLTLHVGIGTFKPVKCQDITKHQMEAESFRITPKTEALISKAKSAKSRIIAVGTTSLRALESYAAGIRGSTGLFIYPGFKFRMTDCLLTNFHLPRTTLLMLVCAFAGSKLIKKAYQEAIEQGYRFYSYGDAMLII